MNLAHLIWIIPLAMFAGFQIGSIIEKIKNYNFADEELDLLRGIYNKATAAEKSLLGKLAAFKKAL